MKRVFGSNAHEPRRGFPGLLALRVPHVRDRVRVQFRFAHTGVRQVRADDLRDVDEVAGAEHAGELLARLVPQRRRGDARQRRRGDGSADPARSRGDQGAGRRPDGRGLRRRGHPRPRCARQRGHRRGGGEP